MADYDPSMIDRYTDYRRFIADALVSMGASRALFAREVGLSEAMVSQVLAGKRRLRPALLGAVAGFFHLGEDERLVLGALLDLENDSERARATAWATLRARRRFLDRDPEAEAAYPLTGVPSA